MKIKKFSCSQCGAPKINPYTLPYIICDFCGAFTDIDFSVGMEAWNKDPKRTNKYNQAKIHFENKLAEQLGKNDKAAYQETQYKYWDVYYDAFPEYLPPSINTDEKYSAYLEVCAISSTDAVFDPKWSAKAGEQALLQKAVTYDVVDGKTVANSDAFFKLAHFYIAYVKASFIDFYNQAKFSIMQEILPEDVHLKMKLSMFVQAWIPYLREEDVRQLLLLTNFNNEYIEVKQDNGNRQACQFCSKEIFVPKGSYKVNCEACHKINNVQLIFHCSSCGMENKTPDNPALPATCINCGTKNKLIKPELG
ncbi:MAG TPA: hypothetical protein PKK18_05510 [Chitinophagales bacterium]|nr:hypothetical protein [Chitinophagales bacterium]HMW12208.1 hypothetical protein [Chitinophagales bacterium]HMX60333.1 hypothetical protein [Chitinophagales bacterium]HMY23892.1 hypothetical protein [Chitinophagales bacterium]HMZ33211.1 hypothetical protein [Chitinophagales bacterium]